MGFGSWTRWGRGSCEGYGLDFGTDPISFRAMVVRNSLDPQTGAYTWRASINGRHEKQFPDKDAAMAHVERELRIAAGAFFEHWSLYTAPNKRAQRNL